ncbi:MAG: succinylglutamate desuccinylase/aspartoacylase family protein [Methylococcaceae bacterium]|nr:succinylglutamate desuccinylase/aspartoacylase family protein [Methylococcaceae bacterium]
MPTRNHLLAANKVKIHYSFKKVMTGSDLSLRRLPLMCVTSANPGPVVWLTACSHGDEVSGIVVIQEVFKSIRRHLLCGTVRSFPLMNPLGFETGSRTISMTGEDLNRSFPGNPNGSLGERIAHSIFDTILRTRPALVLDLHADWIESIPYILVDHDPGNRHTDAYRKAIAAGKEAGMCLIVDAEELKRSLSCNLLMHDIPALTLELGKPNVVSEPNVICGLEAIGNILANLGMIEPRERLFRYPLPVEYMQGRLLKYSDKPYGSRTGIIRFLAKPGQVVIAKQPLAKIVNAFGRHQETLTAMQDALVLGHSDSSAAFPGMPVMAFGILHSTAL